MTGDNTTITSTNFSVDAEGNMFCNNANIKGDIESGSTIKLPNFQVDANGNVVANSLKSNNAEITGGKLLLFGGTESNPAFQVSSNNGYTKSIGEYMYVIGNNGSPAGITVRTNYSEPGKGVHIGSYNNGAGISVGNGTIDNFFDVQGYNSRVYVYGPIYADSFNNNSKEDIKKNIKLYDENAIELLKKSNIYTFNYKTEKDDEKKHIGFIIGEKYKTPDELISQTGDSINNYSMCSVLWKAVQEQQEEIEKLQKEIEKLKEVK